MADEYYLVDTAAEVAGGVEEPDPSGFDRRQFVRCLGAGLLVTVSAPALGQGRRVGRSSDGRSTNVAARIHVGNDGRLTVMAGKVELGQGARAELTQAAAEELRVAAHQVLLLLADTDLVPNDGITAGSQTTPRTVPAVRRAAAAARELLIGLACRRWQFDRGQVEVKEGVVTHKTSGKTMSYGDLARTEDVAKTLAQAIPSDVALTPVSQWKVLGSSLPRPNRVDVVTGAHRHPSDIRRPDMLYGKVLRPPRYGATLESIDLAPAKALDGVLVVREGAFVGCAAPTQFQARQALEAIAKTAVWKMASHPSSKDLFAHLKRHAQTRGGGGPGNIDDRPASPAGKVLRQEYHVAYIQHVPMEPRAGVAEWKDGKLTAWASTANPFGVRGDLANGLGVSPDRVRVIVPDIGCAFGGKHQCEPALEAARLARAAGRPVSVQWTREEEFTWAYFRPAAVLELRGELDGKGSLVAWKHLNINSGRAAIDTPYEIPRRDCRFVSSDPPLRQGSYRALAATANNFAREVFVDELAHAAAADPLAFRLAHLTNPRLRTVLETAAAKFDWAGRQARRTADVGVGIACGTEKGSYVATCAEVAIDRPAGKIQVRRICEVFECGTILNPANLLSQVQGCILMGLGGALSEEVRFESGKLLNANFARYQVPRFKDVPELDIHLLNRPDLEPAGGGETPIIAVAPAVANAVFAATGVRVRSMPIRLKG